MTCWKILSIISGNKFTCKLTMLTNEVHVAITIQPEDQITIKNKCPSIPCYLRQHLRASSLRNKLLRTWWSSYKVIDTSLVVEAWFHHLPSIIQIGFRLRGFHQCTNLTEYNLWRACFQQLIRLGYRLNKWKIIQLTISRRFLWRSFDNCNI